VTDPMFTVIATVVRLAELETVEFKCPNIAGVAWDDYHTISKCSDVVAVVLKDPNGVVLAEMTTRPIPRRFLS
jgi:hypothetical protein